MVFLRAFSSARVPYQAARARDIRRQNSCQSPLYVIAAQGAPPGLGEIEYLHSRIVGRCPAMLMSETGQLLQVVCRWAGRKVRFSSKTDLISMPNSVAH